MRLRFLKTKTGLILQYFEENADYWRNIPTILESDIEKPDSYIGGEYPLDMGDLYKE